MTALVPGSPEWIAERRTGLGGTDIPKILEVSRFGGRMDVYMDKKALTAPLLETEAMKWGKILEEPVAREYAFKTGRKIRRAAGFLRHPVYPFLYANLDRWSEKLGTARRVYEGKTSGEFAAKEFGEEGTDQVPPDYLVQSMHYLSVTGKDVADLAVLVGGQKHRIYTIERDDELIEGMTEASVKFWRDMEQGIPPEIDGTDGSKEYLAYKYRDEGSERPMDEQLALLATAYAALKAGGKENEKEIATVGNKIRDLMGNARMSQGEGVRILYSERKGAATVKWAELVESLSIDPSVVAEFTAIGAPTRALTVTMQGDI